MSEEQEEIEIEEICKFQKELDDLIICQSSKGYTSCFSCFSMFTCKTRKTYVSAVYESMNPNINDKNTGFEF